MSTIIEIFRNLGKIVILLFQIVYISIIDYMNTFSPHKDKNTKNKTATPHTRDVCWDSEEWRDEVVHERPHYNRKF